MRRALTIAAIAIVVFGLGVGVYFFFFAKNSGLVVDTGTPAGNPFGTPGGDAAQQGSTDTGTNSSGIAGTQVAPHLLKITSEPVARGFLVLDASTSTPAVDASSTPVTPAGADVRYIDRESGNMYGYDLTQGTSVRLTNHTAPGVQEASWLANGSLAFIRFLTADADGSEHIDTDALPADGGDGRVLARDLSQVTPQGTAAVFTLMPSTTGSVGVITKPDGSAPATLFTSPLSAITLSFAGTNLLAYTKPSAQADGYAFTVDRKSGAFTKILGPLPGLEALASPSGKQLLTSYLSANTLTFNLFDVATHATTALPVTTLAEKCVWTPDGTGAYCAVPVSSARNLPDSWYEGTTAFSDRIWKIDLQARVATLVADLPQLSKDPIDAVSLTLDTNGSALVFMNKRDGSLWAYTF